MKWLKRILLFFVLFLFIIIAAAVIVYINYDPQKLLSAFSSQLQKDYSIGLSARTVKLDLLKGIHLWDVKLLDPKKDNQVLVSFDEGGILYNPILLLNKKIDIIRISVSGIKSTYDSVFQVVSNITGYKPSDTNTNAFTLAIHSISIDRAEIQYQKIPLFIKAECLLRDPVEKSLFKGDITSGHGKISFIGNWNRAALSISGLELGYFVPGADSLVFHQMNGELDKSGNDGYLIHCKDIDLTFDKYRGHSLNPFEGIYQTAAQVIILSNAGLQVGQGRFGLEQFKYDLSNQIVFMKITNMQARLEEFVPPFKSDVTGTLEMTVIGTNMTLNAGLDFSNLQYMFVRNGSGRASIRQNSISIDANLSTAGGEMSGRIISGDIFNGPYTMDFKGGSLDIEPVFLNILSNTQGQQDQTNAPAPALKILLGFDSARYKQLKFDQVSVSAGCENGVWTISEGKASIFRGNVLLKAEYSDNILAGNLNYTDGKLKEFTAQFLSGEKMLYGTISMKNSFKLDMSRLYNSSGEVEVEVKNGEIKDLIVQEKISRALFDIPLDNLFFDSIKLYGSLNKGLLSIRDLSFTSENIRMKAGGIINVSNMALNAISELSISKDYLSGLPNVTKIFTAGYEEEGRVNFKFKLNGTYQKPEAELLKP
jgi:hypothetical protein